MSNHRFPIFIFFWPSEFHPNRQVTMAFNPKSWSDLDDFGGKPSYQFSHSGRIPEEGEEIQHCGFAHARSCCIRHFGFLLHPGGRDRLPPSWGSSEEFVKAAIDPAGTAELYWAAVAIEKFRMWSSLPISIRRHSVLTFRSSLPIQELSQLLRFLLSMLTEGFGLVNPIIINHIDHPQVITMLVVSLPSPVLWLAGLTCSSQSSMYAEKTGRETRLLIMKMRGWNAWKYGGIDELIGI